MTNFEKYKDEILKIAENDDRVALVKGEIAECLKSDCDECKFLAHGGACTAKFIKWLYEEPAPKLTPKERAFCEMFECSDSPLIIKHEDGEIFLLTSFEGAKLHDSFTSLPRGQYDIEELLKLEVCDE